MKKEKELSEFEKKMNQWVADHLSRISFIQKIFFVEHLRTMIHAGISLVESLKILHKEAETAHMKDVIEGIREEVEKGKPLNETLSHYPELFPSAYVKMIEAGELSGKLEDSLKQIETQMKKTKTLTSAIRGAMIYPAIVLFAMAMVGLFMVMFILPNLLTMFDDFGAELPLPTRVLIAFTDLLSNPVNVGIGLLLLIIAAAGWITALKKSLPFKRIIHKINLHLPIAGPVIRQINLARFSLTLSSLLKSAIPIVEAIKITAETCTNRMYQEALLNTAEQVKTGTPLSEILRNESFLFPPIVTEMVMVGERSGEVGELLTEISNFYGEEVDKTMKNFTAIIEPVIILLLGLAVAGMAVAVIMPMYSLTQQF